MRCRTVVVMEQIRYVYTAVCIWGLEPRRRTLLVRGRAEDVDGLLRAGEAADDAAEGGGDLATLHRVRADLAEGDTAISTDSDSDDSKVTVYCLNP
jgi:hypothetical protein